jgi:hypothetical protein
MDESEKYPLLYYTIPTDTPDEPKAYIRESERGTT